ncbi:MAG: hypothetical protein WBC51_00905 [Vicinamibacterales bacterium]
MAVKSHFARTGPVGLAYRRLLDVARSFDPVALLGQTAFAGVATRHGLKRAYELAAR